LSRLAPSGGVPHGSLRCSSVHTLHAAPTWYTWQPRSRAILTSTSRTSSPPHSLLLSSLIHTFLAPPTTPPSFSYLLYSNHLTLTHHPPSLHLVVHSTSLPFPPLTHHTTHSHCFHAFYLVSLPSSTHQTQCPTLSRSRPRRRACVRTPHPPSYVPPAPLRPLPSPRPPRATARMSVSPAPAAAAVVPVSATRVSGVATHAHV
jgi:hypothetical protein